MPIVNTARGTANINPNRIVVDMSNEIPLLKPREYPLTVLTKKLNTKTAHNYRYDWMEDTLMATWVACPAGAGAADVVINLAAGQGALVAANDLLKVAVTGEIMRVTQVNVDAVTVVRSYGTTVAAIIPAAASILVIGNAMMQGSGKAAEKYIQVTNNFNYTQIFKTPFSVTNTLEAMKLYGGKELARLQRKKAIEHAQSIEYALMFGERNLDTAGAQPISTTGGVLEFLTSSPNVQTISQAQVWADPDPATFAKRALNAFAEQVFTYGSSKKTWLCSPSLITFITDIAELKLEIVQGDADSTFGLDINILRTPHGSLNIVQHPLLVQGYAGYSFVLDMEELAYRPLTGRDTKLETNIQANDEDGRRDQFITETGFELKQPLKHGVLILGA
jgi:hypothetical protein